MYLMVTVISDTKKLKSVLKALKSIGAKGTIVIDSMGSTNIENNYLEYRPLIESTLMSISEVSNYKKTILSIIDTEELVFTAMDAVEEELGHNMKKPNTGIMFTIPVLGFQVDNADRHLELKKYLK